MKKIFKEIFGSILLIVAVIFILSFLLFGKFILHICSAFSKSEHIIEEESKNYDVRIYDQSTLPTNKNTEELYYREFNNSTKIKIVKKGSRGEKNSIQVLKTIDGGKTWVSQLQTSDGTMEVHHDSKFTFIDENTGYIYDPEIQVTNTINSSLMITSDGGKHFLNDVALIPSGGIKEQLYCEDVPYKDGDKIMLRVYTIDEKTGQKKYYKFKNKGEADFEFVFDQEESYPLLK